MREYSRLDLKPAPNLVFLYSLGISMSQSEMAKLQYHFVLVTEDTLQYNNSRPQRAWSKYSNLNYVPSINS